MATKHTRERTVDASTRMTDHEALMWNVEKDPWLNPNGASLTLLDQPMDMDRFRRQIRYGITKMPRLYQRVEPQLGRFTPPTWAPDPEFDFDYHVREISLAGSGSLRELFDLAAQLYQEPLDRTRPLWRFVAISGVEGGRGAVYAMIHHVIADGIGQLRMAELYQSMTRDEEPAPEVDLDAFLAEVLAADGTGQADDPARDAVNTFTGSGRDTATHLLRRQAGIGRRMLGEVMMWPVDTERAAERLGDVAAAVQSTIGLLNPDDDNEGRPSGSPLWRNRSRHRHLEHVQVPLEPLKAASKALGGSVNDGFMIALTEGASRYHESRDTTVDTFNTSFVVSTRTDSSMGGNSFTPVPVQVDGKPAGFETRMADLRAASEAAREQSDRSGGISGLSAVINLLPTSLVTQTARRQAAKIDFATSNLRGAPFTLYCAGSRVEATVCMGPLAGTAANITALSYDGTFDIGLFIDPVAIEDPADYRRCVEAAFADLLALAPAVEKPASKKPTPKPAGKKPTRKRTSKGTKKSVSAAATKSAGAAAKNGSGATSKTAKKSAKKTAKTTAKKSPRTSSAAVAEKRVGSAGRSN